VELDKDSLVAESVDRVLDSLTEENSGLLAWLTDNVLEQIEQGGRYNMDANLLEMAKRLKSPQRQTAIEQNGVDPELLSSKDNLLAIRERCREIRTAFKESLQNSAKQAVDVMESVGVHPDESYRKFLSKLYDYVEIDEQEGIEPPKDTFFARAADHEQWFTKAKAKTLLPLVYPYLEAPLNDFCDLWGREYSVYNTAKILDDQLYGLGVASELSRTFQELMKEKNVLCIDDSNALLRDIIDGSDAPFVYEKLGVRFEHFLLDEFQDTSEVQWRNFSPLLKNSESQGGENLIVGDVKQSIYRWRGSDWKLLDETVPAEFDGYKETVLDTNYRSLSNIIGFNNDFFNAAAKALDALDGNTDDGPMARIYADVSQKVGDGFFFTIGYGEMDGGELLRELLYYGVSSISLALTGSGQKGVRACTSRMREDLYPVLEERMKAFRQDHTINR
jgi:ATP-dependent exoDNAse (exonuclease V) beta subunit